jgi:hypothetical protein
MVSLQDAWGLGIAAWVLAYQDKLAHFALPDSIGP